MNTTTNSTSPVLHILTFTSWLVTGWVDHL